MGDVTGDQKDGHRLPKKQALPSPASSDVLSPFASVSIRNAGARPQQLKVKAGRSAFCPLALSITFWLPKVDLRPAGDGEQWEPVTPKSGSPWLLGIELLTRLNFQ